MTDEIETGDEMNLDLPHYDGTQLHFYSPAMAEVVSIPGEQYAARAYYLWDPTDPVIIQMHLQIAMNSVVVTPEDFPVEDEAMEIMCSGCDGIMPWGTMGVLVKSDDPKYDVELLCLECADVDDGTDFNESLWALGVDLLTNACSEDPSAPAEAGLPIRVWRSSKTEICLALTDGSTTVFVTMPMEHTQLLLNAIHSDNPHFASGNQEEEYVEAGLAQLEAMANKEEKK